ncbi:receptor-like protein 32 [Dendrobium catenatum]|uniref:receptor-like protein 32 n=1 Tax=Dendrobium catenatum TaxID=906689 RepID=UPI0009F6B51B|nr:receptor-like protein 32 [Dendrobium catenatum]
MESFRINSLIFLHLLLLSFCLVFEFFSINCNALGQCLQTESSMLLQLKRGFTSGDLDTWNLSTNCCIWEGVTCDESSGRVISINLRAQSIGECFNNFKSMMIDKIDTVRDITVFTLNQEYYLGFLTIMNKGQQMTISKSWKIIISIDFSNNLFEGEIPITIGQLTSLQVLNISHNYLTGTIIPQLGNLKQLESLDLSMNSLSGKIPQELASLCFLEYLNLSYNKLVGNIPVGGQFSTFTNTSFEGNNGLCLLPCNKSVPRLKNTTTSLELGNRDPKNRSYMIILGILFGVGFGGSMAIVVVFDVMCCDRSMRRRIRRPIDG